MEGSNESDVTESMISEALLLVLKSLVNMLA